ncbi:hypothetical protein [Prosthecobacter sp.]|uniref:hypothetical protein n=1 Tax=Prosthecobacter sp. TaxID=1965333 RepID=UPI002AB9138A|nr:hypothetical protein [Prosthecobacter sp.]MDZ4401581.1 hypothetical protein [Prosthecobacter sp.]
MSSRWKTAARILVAFLLLMGTWWLWVMRGHEGRTLGRLIDARVISQAHHCRLLFSTGHFRENRHVFECAAGDILDADKGGVAFHPVDFENENHARFFAERIRPLMDGCIQPPVDWKNAVVCNGEGKGLLTEVFTVKAGSRCFVVLDVF